ncbi:MAG: hypothetical protein LZT29_03536 [Pantoea stewartii]|uniref:hypothetical protein n=1 Tax=Pantoea stewartii TaxID=66269 RepID=UPI0024BD655F|nr:hypothetical protein [Pantoea stewartii]WHT00469.1 MAG: hypothetical protein LZT29_03536 [Pantoea stewartii]
MRSLKFQRLVLISDSKKLANQFTFPKRLNLITGEDNSIGKSTLAKSLLWSLGCDPVFDEEWKSNEIKSILYFTIDGKEYFSCRGSQSIILGAVGSTGKRYENVTGKFSEDLSELVNFEMKLPNRKTDILETPPPAYYYLPFYIDQIKSWHSPWEAFANLSQYSRWKTPLIKYFTGYIKPEHFEIEEDIYDIEVGKKESKQNIEKFNNAAEVVVDISTDLGVALSDYEFVRIQEEINNELQELIEYQTRIYNNQTDTTANIYDLERQYDLAKASASELEEDYKFAVESIPNDILECPLCGTLHDNSLRNRALLLSEKDALVSEASLIAFKINENKELLAQINKEAQSITQQIEKINNKYIPNEADGEILTQVINMISKENVSKNIHNKIDIENVKIAKADSSIRTLKSDQRKLLSKEEKEDLNVSFMLKLSENIHSLGSSGISLSKVSSPADYTKLIGGGAAEAARALLAYQLSVIQQIHSLKTCIVPPFVVDTPNQQEQAEHRYETLIQELMKSVPSDYQVILCAMENDALTKFKEEANVINLNSNRLLHPSKYESLRAEYAAIQDAVASHHED